MISIKNLNIIWKTQCKDEYNFDSITNLENNIYLSCKESNSIISYDVNGNFLSRMGKKGFNYNEFSKPKGIIQIKNYLFVLEKSNKRCQIIDLKSNKSVSFFGFKKLNIPYDIDGIFFKDQFIIFISDVGNSSILKFNIKIGDQGIEKISSDIFLELPELRLSAITVDTTFDRILIIDSTNNFIRVFSLNGIFIKKISNFEGELISITKSDSKYFIAENSEKKSLIHIYSKDLIYERSLYNNLIIDIDDMVYNNGYLYIISDGCNLFKTTIVDKECKSSKLPEFLLSGVLLYLLRKFY